MEALGRTVMPVAIADGVYVDLKDYGGVLFSCYLAAAAGDTYTLTEATTAGGGSAAVLATITRFWTSNGVGGAWTLHTQAAGSTVVTAATTAENGMVVEVQGAELSAGFKFVKLTSTGNGLVHAVLTDPVNGRKPSNLPSVIV